MHLTSGQNAYAVLGWGKGYLKIKQKMSEEFNESYIPPQEDAASLDHALHSGAENDSVSPVVEQSEQPKPTEAVADGTENREVSARTAEQEQRLAAFTREKEKAENGALGYVAEAVNRVKELHQQTYGLDDETLQASSYALQKNYEEIINKYVDSILAGKEELPDEESLKSGIESRISQLEAELAKAQQAHAEKVEEAEKMEAAKQRTAEAVAEYAADQAVKDAAPESPASSQLPERETLADYQRRTASSGESQQKTPEEPKEAKEKKPGFLAKWRKGREDKKYLAAEKVYREIESFGGKALDAHQLQPEERERLQTQVNQRNEVLAKLYSREANPSKAGLKGAEEFRDKLRVITLVDRQSYGQLTDQEKKFLKKHQNVK